ncbi:MAG: PEP-CTERM sorting domain-containing protein [Phycisphaeraceae bacterium]
MNTRDASCIGLVSAGLLLAATSLTAAPTVDGLLDPAYGPALAVQTTQTGFGDNLSELNAAYAIVENGTLYLMLTGNLQNNGNRLEIFIDAVAGGQNVLQNNVDFSGNNPTNDGWAGKFAGFTFDAGFEADRLLIARRENNELLLDYAVIAGDASSYQNVFGGSDVGSGATGTGANASPIQIAYNDSNVAGVTGGTGAANQAAALAVTTGLELAIALADLGDPADGILISAFINGSNHDFLSNQLLGPIEPQGNLGGDGNAGFTGTLAAIDLNDFAGNQYFTVIVPEPATFTLLGLGGLLMVRRRAAR